MIINILIKYRLVFILAVSISCSGNISISSQDNPTTIQLPDGSLAYLNANSEISYRKSFDKRTVKQRGEVFYSVVAGGSPFVVETENGRITVLGTEFNVKTTTDALEVEVEEGLVELKAKNLENKIRKGQKALLREVDGGIRITKAELKYAKWLKKMKKNVPNAVRQLDKEGKKLGKDIKKKLKKK